MTQTVGATFDGEVLLPDQVIDLLPNTHVRLTIETLDDLNTYRRSDAWPEGFVESTFGSLIDDPIERLPQGSIEVRNPLA